MNPSGTGSMPLRLLRGIDVVLGLLGDEVLEGCISLVLGDDLADG